MPVLPPFPLTGNSCPAGSQRPPLEYFRGKSENDQQSPKLPYTLHGYIGLLWAWRLLLLALYKTLHSHRRDPPIVHSHSHTHLPLSVSCHPSTGSQPQSHAVIHLLGSRGSRCLFARRSLTSLPVAFSTPTQERSHTGDTALRPSPFTRCSQMWAH